MSSKRGEGKVECTIEKHRIRLTLAVLEVVVEDVAALGLSTVLLDNNARTANDLAGVAFPVDLAETSPGAENLGVTDLDEGDFVRGAERLDELDVFSLRAGLNENAKVGLTPVQGLSTLAETARETVVNERSLQNLLRDIYLRSHRRKVPDMIRT